MTFAQGIATKRRSLRHAAGFTLLELMIAVAVVGILAAIAIPSYRQYVIRSNRSAAEQYMLSISNAQEQYRLDNRAYAASMTELSMPTTTPELGNNYSFAISAVPPGYVITATAQNAQASDGNLTLDNTGSKLPADKW